MDKSEKLKRIILDRYGSIREFSKVVDIPSTTLTSALDKGIGGMAVDRIIKICEVLNIDIKTFEPISNIKEMTLSENGRVEIKDIIRKKREELGLTYEELGNMVGVGKSTVRKWEMGTIENMRRDSIIALSKALNITLSVIMGWETLEEIKPEKEEKILTYYNKLNDLGKNEAVKRVEELTYINKYIDDETCATVDEDDYLMPVAAHADDLTEDEKSEMDRRIEEYMKNRK